MNAAGEQRRTPRVGERVTLIAGMIPLVVNAVEFDPNNGNLYVCACAPSGSVCYRAEDFLRGWPGGTDA